MQATKSPAGEHVVHSHRASHLGDKDSAFFAYSQVVCTRLTRPPQSRESTVVVHTPASLGASLGASRTAPSGSGEASRASLSVRPPQALTLAATTAVEKIARSLILLTLSSRTLTNCVMPRVGRSTADSPASQSVPRSLRDSAIRARVKRRHRTQSTPRV